MASGAQASSASLIGAARHQSVLEAVAANDYAHGVAVEDARLAPDQEPPGSRAECLPNRRPDDADVVLSVAETFAPGSEIAAV
jgi:hypothetical protein